MGHLRPGWQTVLSGSADQDFDLGKIIWCKAD